MKFSKTKILDKRISIKTISDIVLLLIVLFGGFFSKLVPGNLPVVIVLSSIFISLNITKIFSKRKNHLLYLFIAFGTMLIFSIVYSKPLHISTRYYDAGFVIQNPLSLVFRLTGYILLTVALSQYFLSKKLWHLLSNILVLNAFLISAFLIFEYYTGVDFFSDRFTIGKYTGLIRVRGPFGDPNASGGMVLPGFVVLVSRIVFKKKTYFIKVFNIIGILILLYAISLTASRTVLVAIGAVLISLVFLRFRVISPIVKLIYTTTLVFGGSFLLNFMLRGRSLSFADKGSGQARNDLTSAAIDVVAQNPIFGNGFVYGFHSNLLDLMVSGGIPLLMVFLIFNLCLFFKLYVQMNNHKYWTIFMIVGTFFIVGLGISWLFNILYWVFLAIALSSIHNRRINVLKIE